MMIALTPSWGNFKHKKYSMATYNFRTLFFALVSITSLFSSEAVPVVKNKDFLSSFVNHYDFRAEGRFTHEYHPFLLKKTAESLHVLHERLSKEGMNLAGHIVISGYEANAIPSYYTNLQMRKINDEMSSESKEGWSIRLHNRFGFMTGFLFRNFNRYSKQWASTRAFPFIHINPFEVELFRDEMNVFQQHAFGESFDYLNDVEVQLSKDFKENTTSKLLDDLLSFWKKLYESEVTLTGNLSAATQDILFSIEYGNFLKQSSLPFYAYYVGGDITYPIETSLKQQKEATKNAQDFVTLFAPSLKSINEKRTAYVFCSFVDGVGKSTMLGNIKNWMKHGDDVSRYTRVDNSSSQYAEVFEFSKDVFIADLPAQISHFTYKPDGLVYVDAATELTSEQLEEVASYVRSNSGILIQQFNKDFELVQETLKVEGPFAVTLNDPKTPHYSFIKNLILLKRHFSNLWVPFSYKGFQGVFLANDTTGKQIRIIHPLSGAASHGLKNIESEQMLFFDGIRFPLSYSVFLQDLVKKLKEQKIEEIVFVNFTSMYPRSCRENIRINYLLQQMALVDSSFAPDESLYKKFVNASELYGAMNNKEKKHAIKSAFSLESAVRYILYEILEMQERDNLDGLSITDLNKRIQEQYKEMQGNFEFQSFLNSLIEKKCTEEYRALKNRFGLSKEFVNIQQLSFEYLEAFSQILSTIFTEVLGDEHMSSLWEGLDDQICGVQLQNVGANTLNLTLQNTIPVLSKYQYVIGFKDEKYLTNCLRTLRAAWYATLGNILYGKELNPVPPMLVKTDEYGQVYVVQRQLDPWKEDTKKLKIPQQFHLNKKVEWGEFQNVPYCLQWKCLDTNTGIYGFGILPHARQGKSGIFDSAINQAFATWKSENKALTVMPTSELLMRIDRDKWQKEQSSLLQKAAQNGKFSGNIEMKKQGPMDFIEVQKEVEPVPYLGRNEQRENAKLVIRMLATLEMILKDPDADIVVRKGNKKDFKAALELIEKVTLPRYYGIVFETPLFDNYETEEPLLSWDDLKAS